MVKDDDDEDDGVDITNPIEEKNEETDDNSLDAQSELDQNLALRYSDESENSDPCDDTDHFQRPISTTDPSMILYYNIICAFISIFTNSYFHKIMLIRLRLAWKICGCSWIEESLCLLSIPHPN